MPSVLPPKVNVSIEIKTMVEIVDEGYLGEGATVAEHIKHAREAAENWQWFVRKGGTEPHPIGVRLKVIGVTILPQEPA